MTTLKLTDEIRQALQEHPDRAVEIEDELTRQVYLLMPKPAGAEMIHATAHEAIQAGIDDMEAGRVVPYDEASRTIRTMLKLPPRA
jgi:predicted transcriptional regulator